MSLSKPPSAGVLLYRPPVDAFEVLLAHPGGPYYSNKDLGAWVIPKGECSDGETHERAARREFEEEVGFPAPEILTSLGKAHQGSGKYVSCFAAPFFESDEWIAHRFAPGRFKLEWPPNSGRFEEFPEVDRIAFFPRDEAIRKILPSQLIWLDRLEELLRQSKRATLLATQRMNFGGRL